MECTYSINIDGKEHVLFKLDGTPIESYEQLVSEIKRQATKNPGKFQTILEALSQTSRFEDLSTDNINDNSVGFYSPAELLNNLSKNNYEKSQWNALKIAGNTKRKSIVSVGFGINGEQTGVYGKKVYLNLNYADLISNQIIALTELALTGNIPNYKGNFAELINSDINEDRELVKEYINAIVIPSKRNTETALFLERKIKSAYYKSNIKSDLGSRNVSIARENLKVTYDTYNKLLDKKDENYLPKTYVNISDLKQGDLVLIPNPDVISGKSSALNFYEIFYDYYIDQSGEIVMRTVNLNSKGEYYLKQREALKPGKDKEGLPILQKSKAILARVQNSEVYDSYKYSDQTKYIEVPLKYKGKNFQFQWTLDLLKNPETKILIKKKRGAKIKSEETDETSPDDLEIADSEPKNLIEIKKIKGSTIYLQNGTTTTIEELDYLAISKNDFADIDTYTPEINDQFNFKYKTPSVGDKAIINKGTKDSPELVIGKVIAFLNTEKGVRFTYIYKTKTSYKTASTYLVEAVANPTDSKLSIPLTELADLSKLIENKLKGSTVGKSVILNRGIFGLNLKNLSHSIEDVDEYSSFKTGDILYNTQFKSFHKIVESKKDYIKTTIEINGKLMYMNLDKSNLKGYVLFHNRINNSFANANIWKNRYSIYTNSGENTLEVKVWKNPNGYIWVYDANAEKSDLTDHKNYEEGMIDYTEEMKKKLKDRYKLSELPKALYQSQSNTKDNYNTIPISVSNNSFNQIVTNKLLNYIVPGSFITLFGDKDSYIVEKANQEGLVVSKYVYTKNKSDNNDPDLAYVKSEKFILNSEILKEGLQISTIHLPRWATISYGILKEFRNEETPIKKSIESKDFSDSKEFIIQISEVLSNKFGIKVNLYDNSEVAGLGNSTLFNTAAFTQGTELYINIDKASIAEPLHELLHVIMATMKASNPDNYYRIVNAVQYHPMFKQVAKDYQEINTELLEETFVQLFSKTFRKNIERIGIFNEDVFNLGIKGTIKDLLELSDTLDWEDTFDLSGKSIKNILINFGSSLLKNDDALIDYDKASLMFEVSGTIKELLDNEKLEQNCNY